MCVKWCYTFFLPQWRLDVHLLQESQKPRDGIQLWWRSTQWEGHERDGNESRGPASESHWETNTIIFNKWVNYGEHSTLPIIDRLVLWGLMCDLIYPNTLYQTLYNVIYIMHSILFWQTITMFAYKIFDKINVTLVTQQPDMVYKAFPH